MEELAVHMRIGAGDAGKTAMAAGVLRALISAAFLRIGCGKILDLRIAPDFDGISFAAYVRCIFSCQPGDMMLAAIRYALKEKRSKRRKGKPIAGNV